MKNRTDILALGNVAIDHYLFLESFSMDQEKIRARSAEFLPGGTMGNFACAVSKLGLKTGFVGVVGQDSFGKLLKRNFEKHGIDTTHLRTRPNAMTPVTVLIRDDSGSRVNIIPPSIHIEIRDLDDTYLGGAKVLHTHLFDFDLCLHCAQIMYRNRAIFSLDMELHRVRGFPDSKLDELLSLTRVLFCNSQTLAYLVPGTDVGKAALQLKSRGPETVVVTLGNQGSLAVHATGKLVRVPPFSADAVDATGAGDCFAGGFHYGYLKGWPLQKIMYYAAVAAACVVTQIGARTSQPSLEEFLSLGKSFFNQRESRK